MSLVRIINTVKYLCYFLCMPLFVIGLLLQNVLVLDISVLLAWAGNACFGMQKIRKRAFFFAFQITFFTFLLGRTVANLISSKEDYFTFSHAIQVHTRICLFIALIALVVSYALFENVRLDTGFLKHLHIGGRKRSYAADFLRYESEEYKSVRFVSKWLLIATFPFDILVLAEKTIFVMSHGYADLYVSYTSHLPYLFVKLGDVFRVALFIFLATMPSKKEARIPLLLFFAESVMTLGTGKRTNFVVPLIIFVLYFWIRNEINPGRTPWLTKKHVYLMLAAVPFLILFLLAFNAVRFAKSSGVQAQDGGLRDKLIGFFESIGFSVNVISYEKLYEHRIPDVIYSFGNTTEYLKENVLTQLFFDFPVYKNQTIGKALYGTDFTQTVTYLYSPTYYLAGRGFGSCYIAEAYHDFGYPGIALWSTIYSALLYFVYNYKKKGIIYIALSLCMFKAVLIAPRSVASGFLTEMLNLDIWLVIGMVWFGAYIIRQVKFTVRSRASA
ncbi:MAG: O-antigen polysaccharide polymerase Wzy family protein [Oscillospiraceae bacterium]|nr:O-antigen polysaccharide polymerase Wzy family protein [Oscillospiraceae bacterium]